jgi:small subunit ribosomal protein S3
MSSVIYTGTCFLPSCIAIVCPTIWGYIVDALAPSGALETIPANKIKVNVHTAKPGLVIGKGGAGIEELRKEIENLTGKSVLVNITEIKTPEIDAQLVAENIAAQLEKRISFRRAMKQAMSRAMKLGAKGIKTSVSGRLGGAEIARTEHYHEGTIPLQTLRADIDYGFAEANTTYGKIGVKTWIYKGEVLPAAKKEKKAEGGDQ